MTAQPENVVGGWFAGAGIVLLSTDGRRTSIPYDPALYLRRAVPDVDRAVRHLEPLLSGVRREGVWLRLDFSERNREELLAELEKRGQVAYEADIRALRRYLADHEVGFASETRDYYFDIETDDRKSFPDQPAGKARIISVSWASPSWGSGANPEVVYLECDSDEAEAKLLTSFFSAVQAAHILLAWNGKKFDVPILRARAKKLKLKVDWHRWRFLDMLQVWRRHFLRGETGEQKVSFALDAIGESVLGMRKLEISEGTYATWKRSAAELAAYNARDVEIMLRLEEKMGFVALTKELARLCGIFPDDSATMPSVLVDSVMLRRGRQAGIHFATREEREGVELRGGYAGFPTRIGDERDVYVLDYSAMYPSIITSLNISPETKGRGRERTRAENGAEFRKSPPGLFPKVLTEFAERRLLIKREAEREEDKEKRAFLQRQSEALKVFNNSVIGQFGSPYSRFFDKELFEAVTVTGRCLLDCLVDEVKMERGAAIHGDTDSSFALLPQDCDPKVFAVRFNNEVLPAFAQARNFPVCNLSVDHETTFDRLLIVTKKRYVGIARYYKGATYDPPKIEAKGLEMMRGDTCRYARALQKRVVEGLLREEWTAARCLEEIGGWRERLLSKAVPIGDLVLAQTLTKPLEEYKGGTHPHVTVARRLQEGGREVFPGMKIPFVVVGKEGGRLRAAHVKEAEVYDPVWYWNDRVLPPTARVLDVAHPGGPPGSAPEASWEGLVVAEGVGAGQLGLFTPPRPRAGVRLPVEIVIGPGCQPESLKGLRAALAGKTGRRACIVVKASTRDAAEIRLGEEYRVDDLEAIRELPGVIDVRLAEKG